MWVALLSPGAPLLAQAAQQPEAGPERRRAVIEEVIVTARRIEESLQDTPVSVTAFSQQGLEQIGFADVSDIGRYTPNLDMRRSVGSTDDINVSMRGMFRGDPQLGFDAAVGVYVDGIYIARNVGLAFDIADVERIEVLRGPQGTLFGRNTIGGAINVVTRKPRGEFAVKQQLAAGKRGRRRYHTTVDTPTVSGLSAKLTFLHTDFDGPFKSMHTGEPVGGRESDAGRLDFLWRGADAVSVHYSYDLSRAEVQPSFSQVTDTRPVYADPDGEFYGGAYYDELNRVASRSRRDRVPVRGRTNTSDIDNHVLTVEWEAAPAVLLKSISGYREMEVADGIEFATVRAPDDGSLCASPRPPDYDFVTGTCANPVPGGQLVSGVWSDTPTRHRQASQEFQLLGNAFNERLRYITGLYYFEETGRSGGGDPTTVVVSAAFAALGFSEATGIPEEFVVPQNRGNSLFIRVPAATTWVDNESYAAYGDFSYTVIPDLEVTLGVRYSVDDKMSAKRDMFSGEFERIKASNSWSRFNPSLTVSYRWSDQVNTYAKVATGYRAGGFNQRVGGAEAFRSPFDEEKVTSYEIGWKTDLLKRSLRLNGALFYADYTDRQIGSVEAGEEGVFNDIINAGETVHTGLELDAIWHPVTNLNVIANYGYLNIDVEKFLTERLDPVTAMPSNPGVAEDVSDRVTTSFAPEHTASLALEYRSDPRRWGQLTLRLDGTYVSEAEASNPQLNVFDTQDAYALLNARATLSDLPFPGAGALRVALWGKNLTDEGYHQMGTDLGVLGFVIHSFGEPRSYGLDLVYEFNR